jgi:hypothetical protein
MYEYKGLVLDVLDYNTVIVDVDLGLNCRRVMRFRIKGNDFCLKEITTIYPKHNEIIEYISNLIKGKIVYFISYKTNTEFRYDIEIVYTTDDGEIKFLSDSIKNKFCC